MNRVHFIAIGGSAMHNLAIALHLKGYKVTGSDDEIFEPSKSRLAQHGLLPNEWGWFPELITHDLDAIILGMHARKDNPELIRALELGLKVYSYPEYLYGQTHNKKRLVVGGSHGKTTVTSMIMHVLRKLGKPYDFMVGAQIEGFDTMVSLAEETPVAIFEGDEYLSSPIDLRPKFLWYKPHAAILTGIAWDHINVFPTFENYVEQFALFAESIEDGGTLIYFEADIVLDKIAQNHKNRLKLIPYCAIPHEVNKGVTTVVWENERFQVKVFGAHNLENIQAAMWLCQEAGVEPLEFLHAIQDFAGAARRLQVLTKNNDSTIFFDFAHSPSKLKATTKAVKEQFPHRKLIACMELHTFSSLNKAFLPQYNQCMEYADEAYVYFNPEVVKHKRLQTITENEVAKAFGHRHLKVFTDSTRLFDELKQKEFYLTNLLLMSSGNFNGIDVKHEVSKWL
jgi:UDP-N-acetylmuramate: L-alanyl-gamma-D-glutamyl-meso-diaminopimelate ligase